MDFNRAMNEHYARAETATEQERLKRMYDVQQTEMGQVNLQTQKKLAEKLQSKGIKAPLQEVGCITNIKTGEKRYFLKKGE